MCGGRGECPVDTHEDDIAVSLVIKGNLPAAGSRAALSDLDGTLAESYININDLYILAFEIDPTKGVADGESKLKDIIWSPQQAERLPESSISSNGTVVLLRTFLSSEKYKEDEPLPLWLSPTSAIGAEKAIPFQQKRIKRLPLPTFRKR